MHVYCAVCTGTYVHYTFSFFIFILTSARHDNIVITRITHFLSLLARHIDIQPYLAGCRKLTNYQHQGVAAHCPLFDALSSELRLSTSTSNFQTCCFFKQLATSQITRSRRFCIAAIIFPPHSFSTRAILLQATAFFRVSILVETNSNQTAAGYSWLNICICQLHAVLET